MKHHPNTHFAELLDGQSHEVADDLTLFRVPKHRFRAGQSYGLNRGSGGVILVDAVHAITSGAVEAFIGEREVLALLLTHGDLLRQAHLTVPELSRSVGGAPVLIHEADAGDSGATTLQASAALLEELDIDYYHVPGHTPGGVLYLSRPERYLFAGDGVVGIAYEADPEVTLPSHPPMDHADWQKFVEGWAAVPPPVACVLPLRGQLIFGADALERAREGATMEGNVMS